MVATVITVAGTAASARRLSAAPGAAAGVAAGAAATGAAIAGAVAGVGDPLSPPGLPSAQSQRRLIGMPGITATALTIVARKSSLTVRTAAPMWRTPATEPHSSLELLTAARFGGPLSFARRSVWRRSVVFRVQRGKRMQIPDDTFDTENPPRDIAPIPEARA